MCDVLWKRIVKNKSSWHVKQVIKKKGDKLYVKWKGYDNSFNSSIDKKRYSIDIDIYYIKWINIFLNPMNV